MLKLTVTVVLSTSLVGQAQNWTRSPITGMEYALTAAMTWSEAEAAAQAADGHLVTIRSAAEQQWLEAQYGTAENLWTGLNDQATEGTFVWSSGESSSWRHWCANEPNGGVGGRVDEDFVHLAAFTGQCSGPWNDAPPSRRHRGILERIPDLGQVRTLTVGPSGTFRTLPVAMQAAWPHDRILIDGYQRFHGGDIKSLCFEGDPSSPRPALVEVYDTHVFSSSSNLHLSFRYIDFMCRTDDFMPDYAMKIDCRRILFDRCRVDLLCHNGYFTRPHTTTLEVDADSLIMRDTSLLATTLDWTWGCWEDVYNLNGADGLVAQTESIALERCSFVASDGTSLYYRCCDGTPPNCYGVYRGNAGNGGAALVLRTSQHRFDSVTALDGRGGVSYTPTLWGDGEDGQSSINGGPLYFAEARAYRASCPGHTGTPNLRSIGVPRVGSMFHVQAERLSPATDGVLFFSLDDRSWLSHILPYDLASIGAPGCYVNVDIDPANGATHFAHTSSVLGQARQAVAAPNVSAVMGAHLYSQYISFEAPISRLLPITTTNALLIRIGL